MIEPILLASVWHYIFGVLLTATAVFLILLVLVQRGRGGGLAGAFGGMGGQSAFGTKAGDTFTKVTIGVSIFWILLCVASVKFLGNNTGSFGSATAPEDTQLEAQEGAADGTGQPASTGGSLPGATAPGASSPDASSPDASGPASPAVDSSSAAGGSGSAESGSSAEKPAE